MNHHSRTRRPGIRRPNQAQRRSGTGDTIAGTALRLVRPTFALWLGLLFGLLAAPASGDTVFIEAESMQASSDGWVATANDQTRRASRARTLWGAAGAGDTVATTTVKLAEAGRYRIWVRYMQVAAWRGPFQVAVAENDKHIASHTFDLAILPDVADWEYTWQSFDADLPAGDVTLSLAKHEQKNCVGYVRHVDCLLLTTDETLVPDHLPYGPQTLVRVTMGDGYDRPVYLHLFADHYRSPWYTHYAIGRDGIHQALVPPADEMMKSGDVTPWCNLTPTVYQDSGAALNLSVRHTYYEKATHFRARLEFGRASSAQMPPEQIEVIRTFDVEATPNGLVIIAPPDLESPQNIALLKRDQEFAEEVGALADAFDWPKHGRRPVRIPFLASAHIGGYDLPVDAALTQREQRTLDYFGFNGAYDRIVHGAWHMKNNSYCQPDLDTMRDRVKHDVELFQKSGRKLDDIAACMLMDEPTGQAASFMAQDAGYREQFREWLETKSLSPQDLLVSGWDDVRPVAETERAQFPALHYFAQLFRTRAIGDFMATQRRIIEDAYGRSFPMLVNFSDGAVYHANFCGQGVDYFELLDADDQNAIWGEDWANNSSTYQCGAFNVALMQAAARKRGQMIGHYLIAHAGRTPWDIKTKATSETARGVRMWMNFAYGPNWSSHEGGPAWRSHLWHAKPELWRANAEITREIGAVEEWLLTATPAPAEVALLYSSSSDIWTMQENLAYGFDRMHTWLALTHANTPVDIVPEREFDRLDQYKVCYLSGPNLTQAAAAKLRAWVESGGTLFLTAGAASRDEFNRPLDTLNALLPADRTDAVTLEPFHSAGRFLNFLNSKDTVTWDGETLEVLSVKQSLQPRPQAETMATFADGSPAVVSRVAEKGQVICCGFLPALSYIKPALIARRPLEEKLDAAAAKLKATENQDQPEATNVTVGNASKLTNIDGISPEVHELLDRSHNPWQFSAAIRERILFPVRAAKLTASLICDTPLVDAVELRCEQGILVALSNHTLRPQAKVELTLRTNQPIVRVDSVRHGAIKFEQSEDGVIRFAMPLDASNFVTASTTAAEPFAVKVADLKIGTQPVNRILFLGNSITLHGPAPQIGWTGNWGMAASTEDKDYVHVLLKQITQATGGTPQVMIKNIADFERRLTAYNIQDELKQELAFSADVIIIALGENAAAPTTDEAKAQFAVAFASLFAELNKHGQPALFVRSQFWPDAAKDDPMQQACNDAGGIFIDISKLGTDPTNFARAERQIDHAGVANHPGDKGMQELANALWSAIQKQGTPSRKYDGRGARTPQRSPPNQPPQRTRNSPVPQILSPVAASSVPHRRELDRCCCDSID